MLETIGAITVGMFATAATVFVLQVIYEMVLAFIGFRRFWIALHRSGDRPYRRLPFWQTVWAVLTLKITITGEYSSGSIRMPADPRNGIGQQFYGA